MIQHLRSRPRVVVATMICALVAAPALITGTTSIAAAAPPGAATGILTVGGEANDPLGPPGADFNLWRFEADAYSSLRAELVSPANFGSVGTVSRGRYQIAPNGLTTVNAAGLANLDVFFGAIPRDGWDPAESDALRNFVQNGGGLVLNLNQANFGGLPAWLTSLGLALSPTRAFYGPSDCYPGVPDSAPSPSTSVGSHPVIAGPFTASGPLTMYHTASVLTATGSATPRYNVSIAGTPTRFGIDGPVGDVNGSFTIQTAAINTANITGISFSTELEPLAPDNTFPYTADVAGLAPGLHTLTATATRSDGGPIVSSVGINVVVPAVVPAYRNCPGSQGETVINNISGTTVATIEPGALVAGSGPVVVTTDLDLFSNVYAAGMGTNRNFALNVFGWMMDRIVPASVPPPPPPPETYFPLQSPIRVYDSRLTDGAIASGSVRIVKVTGVTVNGINVPADATSVVANVTAVDSSEAGYLTVYPGGAPPVISTHNFGKGENFANTVVMGVSSGNVSVLNQFYNNGAGGTHVLVDVIGYSRSAAGGSHLRTLAPVRALDSRTGTGGLQEPFHARAARDLTIVGQPGIPANVQAVVLNMTVANATNTGSFVTVWPSGEAQPNISNLNIIAGVTRPNLVVARVANGKISIVNDSGDTDILADIVGYFEPTGTGGGVFAKPTPTRELDTRTTGTPFSAGETRAITIRGLPGVPPNAKTAILKITAVDPTANGGFLTVWPTSAGSTPPNVSNLNFDIGMNIPNLVITQIGDDGRINIFNAFGSTHVLIDVLGYSD